MRPKIISSASFVGTIHYVQREEFVDSTHGLMLASSCAYDAAGFGAELC